MERIYVGLVGAGAIGGALTGHIAGKLKDRVRSLLVYDTDTPRAQALADQYDIVTAVSSRRECVAGSQLVIEAAGRDVVPGLLELVMEERKDLMVLSVGGLIGCEKAMESMERDGLRLLVPSGAIAGIDAVKAARIGGIDELEITTRKAPASLRGAPYLEEQGIDIDAIKSEQVIFEGPASKAIEAFPKNVNVSAMLSIAGIGFERTRVRIIVSPRLKTNVHQVSIKGAAGEVTTVTSNLPSPSNPGTSYLAALSAMAALEGYFSSRRLGT